MGRGLEVDVGSRYDSLLFANTMKMLGTMDDKLKNHLIFRLCQLSPFSGSFGCGGLSQGVGVGVIRPGFVF